ncbi:protein shisa-5-like [Cloeon dipterum]|uniref:protein shisa-5-like n=1 Tax=Cloeon dipterum TaxID=197152 RepID=UPI00321F9820
MQRFLYLTLVLVVLQAIQIGVSGKMNCEADTGTSRKIIKFLDPNTLTCPPLIDDDERYCCIRPSENYPSYYCCDAQEYVEQTGIGFMLCLLIALIVAGMIMCCVCCLCCPCCCWYKRRNQGAVYNTVVGGPQAAAPPVPLHAPQSGVFQQQQPYPIYPPQGYPQQYPMLPQQSVPLLNPQGGYAPAVPPHGNQYPPAVPPHAQPMPPPYSEEKDASYSRQAPYNPNF